MEYNEIYRKVYGLLENYTPLPADCGMLCGKNCCKGDNETGMLLFPHEQTALPTVEKNGRRLAVCEGSCRREERPLSCRIFPFFPAVGKNGIEVVPDERGRNVCPMISHADEIIFDENFLSRVREVGELLSEDAETLAFLKEITEEIALEKRLYTLFTK